MRRYEVTVEPGTTTGIPAAPVTGLEQGPYVAETYEVSIDRQRIIVEIPD